MTFAEREAQFNADWQKRIDGINRRASWATEQQPDKPTLLTSTLTTPSTLTPIRPHTKSVVHIGDKIERTEDRKAKRQHQSVEVLKAFIANENGYTDCELSAGAIGGSDGARRRRYLRREWGISFNVRKDATGLKRYSLSDKEHATRMSAARSWLRSKRCRRPNACWQQWTRSE